MIIRPTARETATPVRPKPPQPQQARQHEDAGRVTVTSPHVAKLFAELNERLSYDEQVRPWNFHDTLYLDQSERGKGTHSLVAPAESSSTNHADRDWRERRPAGRSLIPRVGNPSYAIPGTVLVQSYGSYFEEFRGHPEAKALGPDGTPCEPSTRGLLQPRHVRATRFVRVGKESNPLAEHPEVASDPDNRALEYPEPVCRGCGAPTSRSKWCSEACRKRTSRRRAAPHCGGCGCELQPRQRRWCSDRCRKRWSRAQ
jgi:hypothetical protein